MLLVPHRRPAQIRGGNTIPTRAIVKRIVISVRRAGGRRLAVTDRPSVTPGCQMRWLDRIRRRKKVGDVVELLE